MPQAERKNRTSVESDVFVEGAIHGSFCWRILLAGKRSIAQSACLTLVEAERRAYVGCFLSLDIVERIGMQGLSLDAAERQYIYTSRKASRTCRRRRALVSLDIASVNKQTSAQDTFRTTAPVSNRRRSRISRISDANFE